MTGFLFFLATVGYLGLWMTCFYQGGTRSIGGFVATSQLHSSSCANNTTDPSMVPPSVVDVVVLVEELFCGEAKIGIARTVPILFVREILGKA